MTKQEKKTAAQVIVMLEELKRITKKQIVKDEAQRLIEKLIDSIENKPLTPHSLETEWGQVRTKYLRIWKRLHWIRLAPFYRKLKRGLFGSQWLILTIW